MRTSLALALLTAGALPATAQSRLSKPVIDTFNHHIVRVTNNGPSQWADTNGWKLVLERTVQPADGSPGELGQPSAALLLADGQLIVSDSKPMSVNLYDASGRFVRTIGRVGEGPGEYRAPSPMLYHDTVVVHDPRLRRGTVYDQRGNPLRSFATVCCSFGAGNWVDDHGVIVLPGLGTTPGGSWVRLDVTGRRIDSFPVPLAAPPHTWTVLNANGTPSMSFSVPFSGQTVRLVLHDGRILYGATDQYQLVLSSNGRDTVGLFGRAGVTAAPVPRDLRDSALQTLLKVNSKLAAVAKESDMPPNYPLWRDITQDGNGNLWIERGTAARTPRRFDVFTRDGIFLGAVSAPALGRFASWNRDHLAVIDTDANDLPRIQIYRIDRRGH